MRLVVVLLAAVALASPAEAGRSRNLVASNDFALAAACQGVWDSYPLCAEGWAAGRIGDATIEWFQRQGARDVDDPAARMSVSSLAGASTAQIEWSIPAEPGHTYAFSALVMGDDLRSRVTVVAQGAAASGASVGSTQLGPELQGSFVWQRLGMAFTAPPGTTRVEFRLRNDTPGSCRGSSPVLPDCGTAWFDDAVVYETPPDPPPAPKNLCDEGWFLDVSSKQCVPLTRPAGGFRSSPFDSASIADFTLSAADCNATALNALLTAIRARPQGSYSRLNLPACEIDLTSWLNLPSNFILQGAGTGRTRLRTRYNNAGGGLSGVAVRVSGVANVIVRDLTIDGERTTSYPSNNVVGISNSTNVLVERTEVIHAGGSGILWSHSTYVTVRYSVVARNKANHAIGIGDCTSSLETCPYGGDFGQGEFDSRAFQILSSWSHHAAAYGGDVNSVDGEIAGNVFEDAQLYGGLKVPNAKNVLVRHNRFARNATYGFSLHSDWRMPDDIVFDDNTVVDNRLDGLYVPIGENLYIRHNVFARNGFNQDTYPMLQGVSVGLGALSPPFNYLAYVLIEDNDFYGNAGPELRVGANTTGGIAHVAFNRYTGLSESLKDIRLQRVGITACLGSEEQNLQILNDVAQNPFTLVPCN